MIQMRNHQASVSGIIFDLDGTLIKSVVDFPKMKNRMIEYIQSLNLSNTSYTPQQTTNEIISNLNEKMTEQKIPEAEQYKIFDRISEILTEVEFENIEKVKLLPGVIEFVSECWFDRIKMGILTRASLKYTLACLEQTEIKKYFSIIVSRDEFNILKAKPHQHALNHIIKELKVASENIMFVGDHKIDYICAREGNIRFIGVLTGAYNRALFGEFGYCMLVENFYELSKLVKEINQSNRY